MDEELKKLGAISADEHSENNWVDEDQANVLEDYLTQPEMPMSEVAGLGLAQGGTLGFAPRIGGAMGAAMEKAAGSEKSLQDLYNEYLEYNKKLHKRAEEESPWTYGTGELAGGLALPVGSTLKLGKEAPMLAKMAEGALIGAKVGTGIGLSQSENLADVPQDIEKMGQGMAMGGALGMALPPVIEYGVKKPAHAIAKGLESVFGPAHETSLEGMRAGYAGEPQLATEAGQALGTEMRGEFAKGFVEDLRDVLKSKATNKREIIRNALAENQIVDPEQLDVVYQRYLQANPKFNEDKAIQELAELKEILLTAKEGPKKIETVRHYFESPNKPAGTKSEMPETLEELLQPINEPVQPKMSSPIEQVPAQSPSGFAGHEAVHKATIKADDEEAYAAFQHKIQEKLADEKALGTNYNSNPIEIEKIPIPGSDKVRLIAKRAKVEEPVDEFAEQAKALAQREKEEQKIQALLEKQQEEALKMKQQQEAEMLKPKFQDIQQEVREGGRDLTNPEELYALYKTLKNKSKFAEGRGFATPEMNKMASHAAEDVSKLIKQALPETEPIDADLTALNNIAERLGIDTTQLKMPGGTGEKAKIDATKKVLSLLDPETLADRHITNDDAIKYITEQLRLVQPELANDFDKEVQKQIKTRKYIKEFSRPYEPGGINWIFNWLRRNASKIFYSTGYNVGTEAKKTQEMIKPAVEKAKTFIDRYTPHTIKKAAERASQSSDENIQTLGKVLNNAASMDDRSRNAVIFGIMQNPAYRQWLTNETEVPNPVGESQEWHGHSQYEY